MAHTTLRRAAARTLLGALLVSGLGTLPATSAAATAPHAAAPALARCRPLRRRWRPARPFRRYFLSVTAKPLPVRRVGRPMAAARCSNRVSWGPLR